MKYANLVPIRSKNEDYSPFTVMNLKTLQHKRVQSETPSKSTTFTMGIQCDSSEKLGDTQNDTSILVPNLRILEYSQENLNIFSRIKPSLKNNNYKSLNLNEKISFPNKFESSATEENLNFLKKLKFIKRGNLMQKKLFNAKTEKMKNIHSYHNSSVKVKKTCKIIDLTPTLRINPKLTMEKNNPWQSRYTSKEILNSSRMLNLGKKYKNL